MAEIKYWLIGEYEPGKWAVDGPYDTDKEANEMGFQLYPGQIFKVRRYATIDKSRATAMWKHENAGQVGLSKALKPVRHFDRQEEK